MFDDATVGERRMNAKDAMIESVRNESPWLIMMRDIVRAEVQRQLTAHKEQQHESIQRI